MSNTLIEDGIRNNHIKIDDDGKFITYVKQNKRRNFENPEEKVQAESFLRLILIYQYPEDRIKQFVTVQMGSETREADIIVYADADLHTPLIVVECKKETVTEAEFQIAVNQGFSYSVAEGAAYTWITSGIRNEYYSVPRERPKARVAIPDIPKFGIRELPSYKYVKGGGSASNGQQFFDLETVSEDELTRRFQLAHQALWSGGQMDPTEAFDEFDKLIFCKIWDERNREIGSPYHFQIIHEKPIDNSEEAMRNAIDITNIKLLDRLKKLYDEGKKYDPKVFDKPIDLDAAKVRTVVGYLESINIMDTDLDSKGRAFETFMGSFFRGDFGQYFTPRPIVKFIVDVLPISNKSRVLDTSCGSGGFLLHALDKVRKDAARFYNQQKQQNQYYRHWHDFASFNLFGIELNDKIARTAKMNMIIHDDGHTNVVSSDGLLSPSDIQEKTGNKGFSECSFDFILTNPPFGSTIKQTESAYLHQYRFGTRDTDWLNPKSVASKRPNQDTEVLFIEQAHNFLKDNGYLAIVIPDGIITNSSMQYVRDYIEELFRIVAVISLPQTAFAANGAGVKSSILFLRKHAQSETEAIQASKDKAKAYLLKEKKYEKKLKEIETKKKTETLALDRLAEFSDLTKADKKQSAKYVEAQKSINAKASAQIDEMKKQLEAEFAELRKNASRNYKVFMAIAEDIGYDATGRQTQNNELDLISESLKTFIEDVERGIL